MNDFIVTDICGLPIKGKSLKRIGPERRIYVRVPAAQQAEEKQKITTNQQLAVNPKMFHKRGLSRGWYQSSLKASSGPDRCCLLRGEQMLRECGWVPEFQRSHQQDSAFGATLAAGNPSNAVRTRWKSSPGESSSPLRVAADASAGFQGSLRERVIATNPGDASNARYLSPTRGDRGLNVANDTDDRVIVSNIFGVTTVSQGELDRRASLHRKNIIDTKCWRIGLEVPKTDVDQHEQRVFAQEMENASASLRRAKAAVNSSSTAKLLGEEGPEGGTTSSPQLFVPPAATALRRLPVDRSYAYHRQLHERRVHDETNMIAAMENAMKSMNVHSLEIVTRGQTNLA